MTARRRAVLCVRLFSAVAAGRRPPAVDPPADSEPAARPLERGLGQADGGGGAAEGQVEDAVDELAREQHRGPQAPG